MKNLVPVIVVVLILLGVGGFLFMNSKKGNIPNGINTNTTTQSNTTSSGGNILDNIRDAFSKSASFSCQYPDPTGKTKITTYVKNGAIRVKNLSSSAEQTGNAIMKDNKMWIWSEGKKEGMILTLKNTADKSGTQKDQREEAILEMEKYKQYCKVEIVSDSLFTPPSEVNFKDLDALMQGVGQQGTNGLPNGVVVPTTAETQTGE